MDTHHHHHHEILTQKMVNDNGISIKGLTAAAKKSIICNDIGNRIGINFEHTDYGTSHHYSISGGQCDVNVKGDNINIKVTTSNDFFGNSYDVNISDGPKHIDMSDGSSLDVYKDSNGDLHIKGHTCNSFGTIDDFDINVNKDPGMIDFNRSILYNYGSNIPMPTY